MAYVYAHIRQDKLEVFYIGIGLTDDLQYSRAYSKKNRNIHRKNIVNKSLYTVVILHKCLTEQEAKDKEIELIAMYGRVNSGTGKLCNLTNGGDGSNGCIPTDTARLNMSIAQKNRKRNPISDETKLKISNSLKGKKMTTESSIKKSNKMKGKKQSSETIAKRINTRKNNQSKLN